MRAPEERMPALDSVVSPMPVSAPPQEQTCSIALRHSRDEDPELPGTYVDLYRAAVLAPGASGVAVQEVYESPGFVSADLARDQARAWAEGQGWSSSTSPAGRLAGATPTSTSPCAGSCQTGESRRSCSRSH